MSRRLTPLLLLLFLGLRGLSAGSAGSDEDLDDFTEPPWTDKRIADEILRKYRFPSSNTNISVSVSVTVERIDSQIDDLCHLQLLVRQKWMEPQLTYRNLRDSINPIKIRNVNYIWNPQLTIEDVQELQALGKDDVNLYSNGIVEFTQRKKVSLRAEHQMWAFPFDKRNCSLKFGNDDLRASWSYLSGASVAEHESPWKVLDTRKLGRRLELRLRRSLATWFSSLFVPSTALVFCSWIPLWLSSESQTARAVLGASVFFASLLVVLANERDLPRTSYLKAIDLWSALVCLFPLLALVQATMVSSAAYKRRWRQILKSEEQEEKSRWLHEAPYYAQLPATRTRSCSRVLDYVCRIALPTAFCAAVSLYMIAYVIPYSR